MSKPDITSKDHPADDPAMIVAMRLALSLGDIPVAREIGRDVITRRKAWHPWK